MRSAGLRACVCPVQNHVTLICDEKEIDISNKIEFELNLRIYRNPQQSVLISAAFSVQFVRKVGSTCERLNLSGSIIWLQDRIAGTERASSVVTFERARYR